MLTREEKLALAARVRLGETVYTAGTSKRWWFYTRANAVYDAAVTVLGVDIGDAWFYGPNHRRLTPTTDDRILAWLES